jgi:rubredoxin
MKKAILAVATTSMLSLSGCAANPDRVDGVTFNTTFGRASDSETLCHYVYDPAKIKKPDYDVGFRIWSAYGGKPSQCNRYEYVEAKGYVTPDRVDGVMLTIEKASDGETLCHYVYNPAKVAESNWDEVGQRIRSAYGSKLDQCTRYEYVEAKEYVNPNLVDGITFTIERKYVEAKE